MSYDEFTAMMSTLKHARNYLRAFRGQGDCAAAICRNRAIKLLCDAEYTLTGEYARQFSVV